MVLFDAQTLSPDRSIPSAERASRVPASFLATIGDQAPIHGTNKDAGMEFQALSRRRLVTSLFLAMGDIASYFIAYLLIVSLLPHGMAGTTLEQALAIAASAAIILYAWQGLYPGYRIHHHEHLRRRTIASAKAAFLAVIATLIVPGALWLQVSVVGFMCLGLLLQPVLHRITRSLCRRLGIWGERAVIIGDSSVAELIVHFRDNWQLGVRPEPLSVDRVETSHREQPSIALIAGDVGVVGSELATMRRKFEEIILLSDLPHLKVSGLRPADTGGEIGIRLATNKSPTKSSLVRRTLDLAIAIPALLLAAPLILLAAAAILVVDPGPVFFRQAREGLSGKTIHVLKLRTMYRDAEQRLDALFQENPAAWAEWSAHFKLKHDPRILPFIGNLLRSTSLDELPQLVNVIAGEMAIVGPRPFPEYHLLAMNSQFRDKRRSVTPGLTGLWQISERSNADIKLQQQLDEFYIDNRSLWFDWHIILSTFPAVFKRDGAY